MDTRTRQRIVGSNSLKVAVAGLVLIGVGVALDVIVAPLVNGGEQLGVWSGITGLIGAYVIVLSLLVLGILEFLRQAGY